jgi:S-formylglutathione hydrolase FrmB
MNILKSFLFLLLFAATSSLLFGQVDTIDVYSKAMNKQLKAAVVLPDTYTSSSEYPTVYLLHGGSGRFSDWHKQVTEKGILQKMANQYQLIIVTPGVGPASYYYDSPLLDSVKYETYITKELIPHVDQKYKTIKTKNGRAITGLSMGGHGAMMISAKNPELFTAAGSMSGVMNIDTRLWTVNDEFRKLRKEAQVAMLGNINYDAPFSTYTAVGLVDKMKSNGLALIIDCGVDDFLIATNRQIHQLLLEQGVPHEYTERPGAHTWGYWTEALPVHMLFISNVFKKNGVAR